MMVTLLVYAYCTGVYSSRRIERACQEDVAFRVIAGIAQPYFTTINEFRRVHREHFGALFVQVLKLCRGAGLEARNNRRSSQLDGGTIQSASLCSDMFRSIAASLDEIMPSVIPRRANRCRRVEDSHSGA